MLSRIANISLGSPRHHQGAAGDVSVTVGARRFSVARHFTDRDFMKTRQLLVDLDGEVDVIALSGVLPTVTIGGDVYSHPEVDALLALPKATPVVTGHDLRSLYQRWCLRHLVRTEPELFEGRAVGMYTGLLDLDVVPILDDAARAMRFGDPFIHLRTPAVLASSAQLDAYARAVAPLLARRSMGSLYSTHGRFYQRLRDVWAKQLAGTDVFVGPWSHLQTFGGPELTGKIVVTDRAAPHVVSFLLQDKGAAHVVGVYPSVALQHNLDWSVMEAMLWISDGVVLGANVSESEAALRGLDRLAASPEVQRFGELPRRRRRFAFVVQPRDQKDLLRYPPLRPVARLPRRARDAVEWFVGKTAPRSYGLVVETRGKGGVEVDGLVIALPSTPESDSKRSVKDARRALKRALRKADRWGAEIVSLGPTARPMVEASATLARGARVPVTTGHAFQASTTFAAARSAVLHMGFVQPVAPGALLAARCLVLGASGSFGSVAAQLCADQYAVVVLAGPRPDRLLELKTAIEESGGRAEVSCTTEPDAEIARADLIIVATGAQLGNAVLDLKDVKPGCVVCDVARPAAISAEAALRRQDVLVIDGGVVELPGKGRLNCDLGLPGRAIYATLAEAAILALEGRMESFSAGGSLTLERVREMDEMGKRQGVRLAALRGPGGVVTDEDIELCRAAAIGIVRR